MGKTWNWRRLTWFDFVSWVLHGLMMFGGRLLAEWAAFSVEQVFALLVVGFLMFVIREETQGWGIDGIMDLVGPLAVLVHYGLFVM